MQSLRTGKAIPLEPAGEGEEKDLKLEMPTPSEPEISTETLLDGIEEALKRSEDREEKIADFVNE